MAFIQSEDLVYQYASNSEDTCGTTAVDGVSVAIEQGSFVAVVGRNGSGKSTFARHINGILQPTAGAMLVDGKNTLDGRRLGEIRRRVGMVFQNPDNQIIGNVVEEDVAFGPENIGVPSEEIQERVWHCLKTVEMYDERKQSPLWLSGGQKQRVAIAGVLAIQSDCIVLDETTAMLDPVGRREVLDVLRALNRERGVTIILITHYMEEAVNADRILILDRGKIVMDDTPQKVFSRVGSLKALGLDVPQIVELAHELRKEGLAISDDILTVDGLVEELCQYV